MKRLEKIVTDLPDFSFYANYANVMTAYEMTFKKVHLPKKSSERTGDLHILKFYGDMFETLRVIWEFQTSYSASPSRI